MDAKLKSAKLVVALYHKTAEGSVRWAEASTPGVFQTLVVNNPIHIGIAPRSANDFQITIFRDDGRVADRFTDVDINSVRSGIEGLDSMYNLMRSLYETAQRQASGADEIIDNILGELGG